MTENNDKSSENINYKGPPLSINSTLYFAWGLFLHLSHEQNKKKIGDNVEEYWKNLKNLISEDTRSKIYLQNLFPLINSFVEKMGYEMDIYAEYLDTQKNKRKKVIDYWSNLSDTVSLNKEGIIIRISSFLGIGGGIIGSGIGEILYKNITKSADSIGPFESFGLFLLFGFIGLIGAITFIKYLSGLRIHKVISDTNKNQQDYWILVVRSNYKKNLVRLMCNINKLLKVYYPDYHKEEEITNYCNDLLNVGKYVTTEYIEPKKYISLPEPQPQIIDNIIGSILPEKEIYYNDLYLFKLPSSIEKIGFTKHFREDKRLYEILKNIIGIRELEKIDFEKYKSSLEVKLENTRKNIDSKIIWIPPNDDSRWIDPEMNHMGWNKKEDIHMKFQCCDFFIIIKIFHSHAFFRLFPSKSRKGFLMPERENSLELIAKEENNEMLIFVKMGT